MFAPVNVRKLVAIDMALHGTRLIVGEFALTVALGLGFGILSLSRGHAPWQFVLGLFLLAIAVNYSPLLIYAILIAWKKNPAEEAKVELAKGHAEIMRYTRQSFLLAIPLVVPLLAIHQVRRREPE